MQVFPDFSNQFYEDRKRAFCFWLISGEGQQVCLDLRVVGWVQTASQDFLEALQLGSCYPLNRVYAYGII